MSVEDSLDALLVFITTAPAMMSLFNLKFAPRLCDPHRRIQTKRTLSVLIPVRNEQGNLIEILPCLKIAIESIEPSRCEVIFLDDGSTDQSRKLIEQAGFRVISGLSLPPGWTGKNWACHQLSTHAQNEHFLFMDADVKAGPQAITHTLELFEAGRFSALSALPKQEMRTLSEFLIIPWVMHLSIFGTIPLAWITWLRFQSLTLGNGQWIAFKREAYERIGGHAGVRMSWLEDMALARRIVKEGGTMQAFLAPSDLEVRMYRGAVELKQGFAKNLFLLAGASFAHVTVLGMAALLAGWAPVVLIVRGRPGLGFLAFIGIGIWRAAAARAFGLGVRHFLLQWTLGHALGSIALVRLLVISMVDHKSKRARWKGRSLIL